MLFKLIGLVFIIYVLVLILNYFAPDDKTNSYDVTIGLIGIILVLLLCII